MHVGQVCVLLGLVFHASTATAQTTRFTEVGALRGIGPYVQNSPTGGVQVADYDQDGDLDLFVPNALGVPDQLYRNLGDGNFEEIAADVGLASLRWHRTALWFDYDADFDLDLVVAGDCRIDPPTATPCADPVNLELFQQQNDGTFLNVTQAAGLTVGNTQFGDQHRGGLAAGDLNNDGFLDLYVATWNDRIYLFMNDGDGTFTETAESAGFSSIVRRFHQPIMYDVDGNGALDIYQPIDFGIPNALWTNNGNAQFANAAAPAGVNYAATDMGVDWGDFDNDGDFDLYVTNIAQGEEDEYKHNVLFRNDSVGETLAFTEISEAQGVDYGYWGWGTTFLDVDNDGDVDLAATNGRKDRGDVWENDPSRFFLNTGTGPVWFQDVSDAIGFNDTEIASGLIAFDYDRDGDLDLVQVTQTGGLRLLQNDPLPAAKGAPNHYLVIRPRSEEANHFAIGAVIHVSAGGLNMMRLITAGKSTLSQEPAEAFFGLGSSTTADEVTIEWPDGTSTTLFDVPGDQVLTVMQPSMTIFEDSFES